MSNNNINFKINYQKGDTSALDSLKKELIELKSMASNIDMSFDEQEIQTLLTSVTAIEKALNGAFDVNLNTINIQKFNQILAQSGMNAKSLQQGLALAGSVGDKAFLHLTSQLMQFNTATKQTNKFLDSIANSFFNTIKYTAFNTVLNNISGTVQKAYGYVKSLDTSLNDIRIVTGKSADEMERFAEEANQAAKQLAVTTSDYTEGSLIYYQQGLDDETVKTLTDITAMTSNVTGQSMEVVSEQLTAVWNGYQVANQAAEEGMQVYQEYVDKMAAVGATTASDLQELATAMSKVASAASSMGVGFDDLAAQIATIVSVTRQAPESVGTALKTIYARLGDLKVDGVDEFGTKLGEVSTQLQTMGINILDTNGDMRDMSSVMTEVAAKWDEWSSAQKQAAAVAMAGKRQYNNLVALFDNWDMYGEALETSMEAAGTLEKQQEIALDSLANKLDILSATAEDFYDSLLNEDTIKNLVEDLTQVVQLLADFADATGGLNNLLPLLGSTALRVFNKQIADGLGAVIINMRTVKTEEEVALQNAQALQAMFSNSNLYVKQDNTGAEDARVRGLQRLEEEYNKLSQYQSLMNQDEKEQYNNIINLAESAGSLEIELEAQKDTWKSIQGSVALIDKELVKDLSDVTKITQEANRIKTTASELSNFLERMNQHNLTLTDSVVESFIQNNFTENASELIAKFNSTTGTTEEKLQALISKLRELGIATDELVKLDTQARNASDGVKQLGSSLRDNLETKRIIASITSTIGALGQLGSGLSMLSNIPKIWSREDISNSEKMTQSLTAFAGAATALGYAITGLNTTFKIQNALVAAFNVLSRSNVIGLKGMALAQYAWNAAIEASPLGPYIIVIGALIAAIAGAAKAYQGYIDSIRDANKAEIERVNKIQEEIDANQDLYESYNKLYSQYKNGKIEKEDLFDVTDQLCDKYENELGLVAEMSGNYDALTESIRQARDAELDLAQQETLNKLEAAQGNLAIESRSTFQAAKFGQNFTWALTADARETNENAALIGEVLRNNDLDANVSFNVNSIQDYLKLYDGLTQSITEITHELGAVEAKTDPYVQQLQKQVDAMRDSVEEVRSTAESYDNYTTQRLGNQQRLWDTTSLDEFTQKVEEFKNNLSQEELQSTQTIDELTKVYLKSLNTTYSKTYLALNTLRKQIKEDSQEEFDEYLKRLSEGEKEYLVSGKVRLDFVQTKADIEKEIEYSFQHMGTFDVEAPINFQSTLASGTKLKKADKEELAALESENAEVMAGFDDKSTLHQMDAIDAIAQYRIDKNIEFLNNYEQSIKDRIALDEEELKHIYETADKYEEAKAEQFKLQEQLNDENKQWTYQEKEQAEERLQELSKEINAYETLSHTINDLNNDLKAGLSWEQIEDIGFSSLIADLESITNRATAVQGAMELIGQGFKVAASDAEKFANIFPELLENSKALDDGSLQLDQEIVKQRIEGIQAELQARTDAKITEVDQQIALKELEQTYLQEKLKNLELYLQGKQTEQSTIDQINKAGFDYETGLMKLTGEEITTLEKHTLAASNAEGSALVNMLDQVGKGFAQAANAHYAMLKGQQFDWTKISFSQGASSAQDYASSIGGNAEALYKNATTQYEEIYNEALEVQSQLNTVSGELDQLKAQRAVLESTGKAASHAIGNVASGKAGKDSKSGSSKDKKDKELKKLDEEFDRYYDINKALDQMERTLKKVNKQQEKLYGKELIRSLKQENELLENQAGLYEQLYAAQQQEAVELRSQLSGMGVAFDESSGAITNYAQAVAQALATYNAAVTAYNNGPQDEAAQKSLEAAEKAYENFKKLIERYDTLYYKEMQDTQEKLEEIWRKRLENNLKAWEVEVQLKLDWKQLERDWNDFLNEVSKDFKKVFSDLRVEVKNMLKDANTYIGSEGTINTIIDAVHDVTGEIDKLMGGGQSNMFESVSQAQEKLKELNEQLLDSATALHDLWKEAWDEYLDGIDQVNDAFDKLLDRFDRINDELAFQEKLIELLYGDEAYGLMSKLYEGQERTAEVQLQSLKQQVDMWKELFEASGATMDNQMEWNEDQQKYYENWLEAQSKLNDLVLEYIELLKTDYLNTVSDVFNQLEKYISGGSNLSDIATQWERISANAEKYYDSVEGAYYIQTLANKIDESIAKANNLKAQQKLMALREKEINYLREKEDLTEYDIKAAELRYQIALKEIALQDAQQNKTGMKLTRNEQGNWSYQYVADEDDIASKRQELLDAYNDLYQLASDAYEANLEALTELQEKYLESAKAIYEDDTLSNEEREQKLLELREWYLEQYAQLASENQLYRDDLAASGAALLLEIYEQDKEAYEFMTEDERALVDALISANIDDYQELDDAIKGNYKDISDSAKEAYQDIRNKAREVMSDTRLDWTSGAQTIADLWNKDSGYSVKTEVVKAYDAIQVANQKYKDAVDWCAEAVERDFSEEGIVGAIQNAENEVDNLRDKTTEMVATAIPYLTELKDYVNLIEQAWNSVQQAIRDAISLIEEYLRKVGEANQIAQEQAQAQQAAAEAVAEQAKTAASSSGLSKESSSSDSSRRISPTANGYWYDTSKEGRQGGGNTSSTQITGVSAITGTDMYSVNVSNGLTTKTVQLSGQDLVDRGYFNASSSTSSSSLPDAKNYTKQVIQETIKESGQYTANEILKNIFSGASGGYTGSWGDTSGKLAMLHQKELVLNADDTANFLSAVNTIRDLNSGLNHSIQDAVLNAVARTALSVGGLNTSALGSLTNNNNQTDNVYNITAEFPNAANVNEIREAILSLPNIASQYANSTLK